VLPSRFYVDPPAQSGGPLLGPTLPPQLPLPPPPLLTPSPPPAAGAAQG
jgi:hypothetical protein